jgi:branched-chain amino acid transport system substrate-binding protein
MDRRKVGALAFTAMLAAAACTPGGGATTAPTGGGGETTAPSGGAVSCDKGTAKIAIELPQQGSELASSQTMINGINLAVKELGGCAGGYKVEIPTSSIYDDAVNGAHDAQTGARNMQAIVADPDHVAVIGPLNSSVAKAQIPISNEAGLLHCGPSPTNESLTKPEFGALDIRKANPDKINFVRVVTTDDKQGPAAARYAVNTLKAKNIYIIDDTETFGKGIADNFQKEAEKLGATIVGRDSAPKTTTDYSSILTAAKALTPDAIYFGGTTATGGARILKAAVQAGLGDVPYVGSDGIYDGDAVTKDSFLSLAGDDAKNSTTTAAVIYDFPGRPEFETRYKAVYNAAPTGYSATGYACAQVIFDALNRAADSADMAALRENVRAAAVTSGITYDTVLGGFTFDENGDTSQLVISFFTYDPATKAWVYKEALDFAK